MVLRGARSFDVIGEVEFHRQRGRYVASAYALARTGCDGAAVGGAQKRTNVWRVL